MSLRSLIALGLLSAAPLAAQSLPEPAAAPVAQQADPRVQKLEQILRERDAMIRNLLERVTELEQTVYGSASLGVRQPEAASAAAPAAPALLAVPSQDDYSDADRKARSALDHALIQRGGLLLPSGKLEVDTSASYYDASSDAISIEGFSILPVLVVGNIVSDRVRRDVALSDVSARLGLPWNFQLDARVPYGYEQVRTVTADNLETAQRANGLGDIQFGLSRQVAREHGSIPDLLAQVSFKTKSGKDPFDLGVNEIALGTGFYSFQGRLTAVKSSDPMVFFGSLGYAYNVPAGKVIPDPNNAGQTILAHFEPGDTSSFQLGSILAVNPEASLSVAWDQSITRGTSVDGAPLPGSYLVGGTLRLGASYIYAPGKNVDLNLGIGVTRDVPNLQFTVGVPLRFTLWKPAAVK